jgi:flagellar basal body-associated protein FliL
MSTDSQDQKESRKLLILLVIIIVALLAAVFMMLPMLTELVQTEFEPGVGMRQAAIISFFVTLVTLAFFAITAGDGLLGELQFMLAGFFSFFVVIWLLIAWVF